MKNWLILSSTALFWACSPGKTTHQSPEHKTQTRSYAAVVPASDTLWYSEGGYTNKKGEVVIPVATSGNAFSETFVNYAFVYDAQQYGNAAVGINRKGEVMYEMYLFDNGPDYVSDGLFRIKRNGKTGYADTLGNVVIEPKYACAYPFENGRAKVALNCTVVKVDDEHTSCESDSWQWIDKKGNVIK